MRSRKAFLTAAILLAAVGVVAVVFYPPQRKLATSSGAGDDPTSIVLTGIIRDFTSDHPDFNTMPEVGNGHSAGNVDPRMPATRRPLYRPDGRVVDQEYRDSDGRNIAPHLYQVVPGPGGAGSDVIGARVDGKVELKNEATIDAFSSALGPYGSGGNYGEGAYISTNSTEHHDFKISSKATVYGDVYVGPGGSPGDVIHGGGRITGVQGVLDAPFPMPEIDPPDPEDLGPYEDHVHVEGPVTWTGDMNPDDDSVPPVMNFGRLHIKEDAVVTVLGDLVIYCSHDLKVEKSRLVLAPDATLTIYVTGDHDIELDRADFNMPGHDTTSLAINYLGDKSIKLKKCHIYANVLAPYGRLELKDDGHLYGSYIGAELKMDSRSGLHVDTGNVDLSAINPTITVREKIEIEDHADVDGFDSNVGPYGETNSGAEALVMTNTIKNGKVKIKGHSTVHGDVLVGAGGDPGEVIDLDDDSTITGIQGSLATLRPIPVVAPPALGLPPGDDVELNGGTHVFSENMRCKKLKIEDGTTVQIVGDVTIRCDDKLELKKQSEIQLMPGARLTIYVRKEVKIEDQAKLNANTGNPQLVSIRRMSLGGKGKITVKKQSELCAWVQGAQTELKIEDQSAFYGSFIGKKIKVKKSDLHVDMAYISPCVDIEDTAGELGDPTLGGVASESSFDAWFRDVPGANLSKLHAITLTLGSNGVYEYANSAFRPIDGELLGNEAQSHNNFFTYAIQGYFTYGDCAGQFVEFRGGDGAWLFLNDRLAIDLGGVLSDETQFIDVDRLGLAVGQDYRFGLFYAQRNQSSQRFELRTNVQLDTSRMIPPVSMQYD